MIKLSKAFNVQVVLFTFVILSVVAVLYSCKKTDELNVSSTVVNSNIANKFFTIPTNTDDLVKRVAAEIENRNNKKEFIDAFSKQNGFPIWDKVISIKGQQNKGQGIVSISETDTTVYIPLVQEDSLHVNGYILAKVNSDSIAVSYSLAQDYKAYPRIKTSSELTADEFIILIINLDKAVFGYHQFSVTDNSLFYNNEADTGDGAIVTKTIRLTDKIYSNKNGLLSMETFCQDVVVTICVERSVNIKHYNQSAGNYKPCNDYMYENCWDVYTDDGNSGGGGIPTEGGGGGEIPHDYPCKPVLYPSVNPNPLPDCPPPGPGTGTEPNNIDVISSPNAPEYPDISENEPQVSLQSLFNCFAQIPDAGATYSVKLNVDLPVNSIWNAPFNLTKKSPGHTFLTLTKTNGTQTISQSVGFYPIGSGGNPINPTAPGGFKNNGYPDHEYNAAITAYNVSASQFTMVMNNLLSHENDTYNISNNNCTTIGLNAFNLLITPKITVEPFIVQLPTNPPQVPYLFMQSPQKLYKAIETFQPGFGLSKQFDVN